MTRHQAPKGTWLQKRGLSNPTLLMLLSLHFTFLQIIKGTLGLYL